MSKKIGEMLVERGLLSPTQVEQGLDQQKFHGGRVGSLWVQLGFVQEKDLLETLAVQKRAKPVKASLLKQVSKSTLDLLPVKIAAKYKVVPLVKENRRLSVAICDPNDLLALDELQFISGCVIEPFLATEKTILAALERFYGWTPPGRAPSATPAMPAKPAPPPPPPTTRPKDAEPEAFVDEKAKADAEAARKFWSEQFKPPAQREAPTLPPVPGAARAAAPAGAPTAPVAATAGPHADVADGNDLLVDESETVALREEVNPLEEASRRLARVEIRDDIADVLLWCTEGLFKRSALFIFQKSRTLGWTGQGEGLTPEMVRRVVMPVEEVSIFTLVRDTQRHYIGPLPKNPPNERFVETLGGKFPPGVIVIPFGIERRALGCLYGEDDPEQLANIELPALFHLLQKSGLALEILVLRAKLMSQ